MADEENKEEGGAAEGGEDAKKDAGGGGGGIMALIMSPKILIPLVALVGIGMGAGVMLIMGGGDEPPAEVAEGAEGAAKEAGAAQVEVKAEDEEDELPPELDEADEDESPEENSDLSGVPDEFNEALHIKFDPLVLNIFEKNSIHYLKLQIEFTVSNAEVSQEISLMKPLLRDRLLFIFSDTTLREVLSPGGKSLLKEDIVVSFNKILKKGKIKQIYFTDFTVQ